MDPDIKLLSDPKFARVPQASPPVPTDLSPPFVPHASVPPSPQSAFKDGYAIEEDPSAPGRNFVASRLGSVQATVTEGGEGVSGVLLSLSSRGFRSNNVTLAGGQLTFLNLAPGEYYLKPALKEYVFTPAAATITVGQGEAKTASFAASRTQYRCPLPLVFP
eukprot:tig00020965_g16825.t1